MPTPNAHGINVAKMCQAFGNIGIDTVLVAPYSFSRIKDDVYSYYGLNHSFSVLRVHSINLNRYLKTFGYWLRFFTYTIALIIRFFWVSRRDIHIHTREFNIAYVFKKMGFSVSYEAHRIPTRKKSFFKYLKGIDRVVANSNGVAEEFRQAGFPNVVVCRHGLDVSQFSNVRVSDDARIELGLPVNKKIVMYTGALYGWKGVSTVVDAATVLAQRSDIEFVLIGGSEPDVLNLKKELSTKNIKNINVFGHVDYKKIADYLVNADALLLPNNTSTTESVKYTSPIKLPQYMASKVPIIASNLMSIREILNEKNAILTTPGDGDCMAKKIEQVLDNPNEYDARVKQAYDDAISYTWEDRAQEIADFLGINSMGKVIKPV